MLYEVITGGDSEMSVAVTAGFADPGAVVTGDLGLKPEGADAAGQPQAEDRPRPQFRITSYNVCYTKLLRTRGASQGGN